jgi:hypothetical protein
LDNIEVADVAFSGYFYTWNNKQEGKRLLPVCWIESWQMLTGWTGLEVLLLIF